MRPRLEALTATRGIAALIVVIYHYGEHCPPFNKLWGFFAHGGYAVGYFFVLSGFVMVWGHAELQLKASRFWLQRIIRLAPLYWLLLGLFLAQYLWRTYYLHYASPAGYLRHWWVDFFFLQSWYIPALNTINTPAWSLGPELFFYLLFPLGLGWLLLRPRAFALVTAGLFLLSQAVHLYIQYYVPNPFWYDVNYVNPLLRLCEFAIGMCAAQLAFAWSKQGISFPVLPVFVLVVLLTCFGGQFVSLQFGLMAPLFALLVTGLSLRRVRWLEHKTLQVLGNASYGIYLLQGPVFVGWAKLVARFQLSPVMVFYSSLAGLIILGCCSYYCFELPMQRFLRKRLLPMEHKA